MFVEIADPNTLVSFNLALVAASVLANLEARTQAVVLLSFLEHYPGRDVPWNFEQERLRKLTAQMRSELSSEDYAAAWEEGRSLTWVSFPSKLYSL